MNRNSFYPFGRWARSLGSLSQPTNSPRSPYQCQCLYMMLLRPLLSQAPVVATAAPTTFNLPVFAIRGGAAAAAASFDMGLAKTRLEGLAYSTVTTLMLNAALRLFSTTPKKLEPLPDDASKSKVVKFVSTLSSLYFLQSYRILSCIHTYGGSSVYLSTRSCDIYGINLLSSIISHDIKMGTCIFSYSNLTSSFFSNRTTLSRLYLASACRFAWP